MKNKSLLNCMLLTILLVGTAASAEDSSDVCPKENFSGDFFAAPLKYTEMIYAGATGNGGGLKSYVAGNTNWMSAIPDEYYLNEISIPGAHDAGCSNVWTKNIIGKLDKDYAITQDRQIPKLLEAGVRLLDLRFTNCYKDHINNWEYEDLYLCHGSDILFYCLNDSGAVRNIEGVLNDVHQFLRDNPTETVILDVSCEYDDSASSWRVNPTLKKKLQKYDYLSHKDETGYPYELWIYAGEPGSASGNILPKLGEVRGKAVIISSQARSIGLGLQTGSSNGTGNFTLGGVNFAYENHYDVDAKTKSSAVRSFYDDNKIYITLGDWGHWDHILKGLVVYTSSNCAASLGNHPYTIAQTVNPEANSFWGTFKSQGLLAGWVGADFVGTSTSHNRAYDMNADAIWQVNFRNDYSGSSRRGSPYYFIIYENVAGNPIHSQEVLKGAALTLPQPPTYPVAAPNWIDVDTGEVLDGTILPERDITLKANASYYSLQGQNEQQLVGAGTSGGCNAGVSSVIFAALLVIARKMTKK